MAYLILQTHRMPIQVTEVTFLSCSIIFARKRFDDQLIRTWIDVTKFLLVTFNNKSEFYIENVLKSTGNNHISEAAWFSCQCARMACECFGFKSRSDHFLDLSWVILDTHPPRLINNQLVCLLPVGVQISLWPDCLDLSWVISESYPPRFVNRQLVCLLSVGDCAVCVYK